MSPAVLLGTLIVLAAVVLIACEPEAILPASWVRAFWRFDGWLHKDVRFPARGERPSLRPSEPPP
jgi:hypothetical protein